MADKHLHIICLDVPYPVDYGGVFDLFYKLESLHKAGIRIHLHCFEYGRGQQPELNKYCDEVHYYHRREGHKGVAAKIPYIVASRISEELANRLLQDEHPILMEGVHCSYILLDPRFAKRKLFLRLHNVEYRYYRELAKSSRNLFRKMYYRRESRLLKEYERAIANKAIILAVSELDAAVYRKEFGATRVMHLPVFLPFHEVLPREGMGCFCLYHGNLSVEENEKAATWLITEVFNDLGVPFIVAGKNPSARLQRLVHQNKHFCIVANPSWDEMQDLVGKAQINILPSFNNTGIKLKLLNVLYNGRHCVTNDATLEGSMLKPACHVGVSANALKSIVAQLYHQPLGEEETRLRQNLLEKEFNNETNAQRLITWIW